MPHVTSRVFHHAGFEFHVPKAAIAAVRRMAKAKLRDPRARREAETQLADEIRAVSGGDRLTPETLAAAAPLAVSRLHTAMAILLLLGVSRWPSGPETSGSEERISAALAEDAKIGRTGGALAAFSTGFRR